MGTNMKSFLILLIVLLLVNLAKVGALTEIKQCFRPQDALPSSTCALSRQYEAVPATPSSYDYSYSTMRCEELEFVEFRWSVPWWATPQNGQCAVGDSTCNQQFGQNSEMMVVTEESDLDAWTWAIEARAIRAGQGRSTISWGGAAELNTSNASVAGAGLVKLVSAYTGSGVNIYDTSSGSGAVCNSVLNDCTNQDMVIRVTRNSDAAGPVSLDFISICFAPPQ